MNTAQQLSPSKYFSIELIDCSKTALLKMEMTQPYFNSFSFPQTIVILRQFLPQIFTHLCFNTKDLPFYQEACQTELGHLFEHILLEHLRQLKIKAGFENPIYKGETCWNWNLEKEGTFHIEINTGREDLTILQLAVERSIILMDLILSSPTAALPQVISENSSQTLQNEDFPI